MYSSAGNFVKICLSGRGSIVNTRGRLTVSNEGNLIKQSLIHIL